jgi:hypothetical protein
MSTHVQSSYLCCEMAFITKQDMCKTSSIKHRNMTMETYCSIFPPNNQCIGEDCTSAPHNSPTLGHMVNISF